MSIPLTDYNDVASIVKAIKDGELGENLAKRAQKLKDFTVREVSNTGIDYRVFNFDDAQAGYTVIIDKNKLVILCKSWGGGYARNFKISNKSGRKLLYFEYDMGSGLSQRKNGEYNLGSGKSLVSDNN